MQVIPEAIKIFKLFLPIGVVFAVVIMTGGVWKWWERFNNAVRDIFKNPGRFIFSLLMIGIILYFFFVHIMPMINEVI